MAVKKYVIEVDVDNSYFSPKGEVLYLSKNGTCAFFKHDLESMEEITETPKEEYDRGYSDGLAEGIRINGELVAIELYAEEICKLYKKILYKKQMEVYK